MPPPVAIAPTRLSYLSPRLLASRRRVDPVLGPPKYSRNRPVLPLKFRHVDHGDGRGHVLSVCVQGPAAKGKIEIRTGARITFQSIQLEWWRPVSK